MQPDCIEADIYMTSHRSYCLAAIGGSAMSDDNPVNSTMLMQVPLPRSSAPPGRRRAHTPMAWARIRPSLKHLYIDLDMTLRDAIQRIAEEHGFHAT